jgi:hypothetical protein
MKGRLVKNILLFSIIISTYNCSHISRNHEKIQDELNFKTDSTITLNVMSNVHSEYPLSQLIDSVRYIELDNADEALFSIVTNIKVTNEFM